MDSLTSFTKKRDDKNEDGDEQLDRIEEEQEEYDEDSSPVVKKEK